VYGLGANALDGEAVKKIYEAKGRPSDNPIIVHIGDISEAESIAHTDGGAFEALAEEFWPGPLTMVLRKREIVPDETTGGLPTVAIRMPNHPVARKLIEFAGCPVAAPSANISGAPSPTKAEHVIRDLSGRVDVILAGDDSSVGIESTVLSLAGDTPTILRPGVITAKMLSDALNTPVLYDKHLTADSEYTGDTPASPGMKYKHYAPKAEMLLVDGAPEKIQGKINSLVNDEERKGKKVGVIYFGGKTPEAAARIFYAELRRLDNEGVDVIIAGAPEKDSGVGFAVMNRMLKSAGYNTVIA
jgi:L-threonylcarbamoyladenylate synthase